MVVNKAKAVGLVEKNKFYSRFSKGRPGGFSAAPGRQNQRDTKYKCFNMKINISLGYGNGTQ